MASNAGVPKMLGVCKVTAVRPAILPAAKMGMSLPTGRGNPRGTIVQKSMGKNGGAR